MSISKSIAASLLFVVATSTFGQNVADEYGAPQRVQQREGADAAASSFPRIATRPAQAFSTVLVPHDGQPPATQPNERELVSILKRNLPQSDQTMQMRDAPEWFQSMMQRIVRENIPDKYVQDKDWGKTDKRWDGVQIRRKGPLRLTTKRRWKEVNHGTWQRYEISPVNPDENLELRIENVHDSGNGKVGFEVALASKLHVHGRRAKWAKGVQMYNFSADADAAVNMRLWCQVGMKLDVAKFPPDVVMVPEVTRANLDVSDFQLQSVSKLDGPVVRQLSGSVHRFLLDKIAEKRHKLPQKINKQIAKNEDKMRLSMSDFASSKWSALTKSDGASKSDQQREPQSASPVERQATTETQTFVQPAEPQMPVALPSGLDWDRTAGEAIASAADAERLDPEQVELLDLVGDLSDTADTAVTKRAQETAGPLLLSP